jgi:spore coat polysaccharide biosynthesis predicted glycosyltransferase SpsG
MNEKKLAIANYQRFCAFEGSEYIASEFALEIVLKLIKKYKVGRILEMGLGIGSMVDTILQYANQQGLDIQYTGTEANEFCLGALKSNVIDYAKLDLQPELKSVKDQKFDLIIIDGYDESLELIKKYCHDQTIIFIEGDRAAQTKNILSIFPNAKHVNIITLEKRKAYAHGTTGQMHYVGGGQLIFVNPDMAMKLHWFTEKVATYIKRKRRKHE